MWVTDENLEEVDRAIKWFEDETGRFLHSFKVPFGVDSPEGAAQQIAVYPQPRTRGVDARGEG
jgi:hypothetical protein